MDASLSPTGKRYFAIAADDTWVHVILSEQSTHVPSTSTSLSHGAVDYFDIEGQPYELHTGNGPPRFTAAGGPADPAKVHERLTKVLRHLRNTVQDRSGGPGQPTVEEALDTLPDLTGRDLEECFKLLSVDFGHLPPESLRGGTQVSGSFWHNFWCH
jgi:hypothetical protein